MSTTQNSSPARKRVHGIFWPLALISVGALILLNNLGVNQLDVWNLLAIYWPLIFVIGALDDLYRGQNIPGAVIMVGLGAIMVAGNLGKIPMDAWQILFRFWPVFIIAWGLDMLFGRRSLLPNLVGTALGLLVVAGLLFLSLGQYNTPARSQQPLAVNLQHATSAEVNIKMTAGPLRLQGGAAAENVLDGSYSLLDNETLRQNYTVSGGKGQLDLTTQGGSGMVVPGLPGNPAWDVKLNPGIPLDVRVELAVGDLRMDFSGTQVRDLKVQDAVGLLDLTLDGKGKFNAGISLPVGRTIIRVPQGASVYIDGDFAVTLTRIPAGWTRHEGVITSPGAGQDAPIHIRLEQPVGLVSIITAP